MDRRDALKKMAAGGTAVVGASVVLSTLAFADSGTVKCRHTYTTAASFTAVLTRPANNRGRAVVTVGGIPVGACPCGGAPPIITYAFSVTLSDARSVTRNSGGGPTAAWQAGNAFDTGSLRIGRGNSPSEYTVSVGNKLDCVGVTGRAVICRFATVTGTNAPTTTPATSLTSTSPPASMPSC